MRRAVIAAILPALWAGGLIAGTLSGEVVDQSRRLLAGVNITIEGRHEEPTDAEGRFKIEAPAAVSVTFTHVGFKPVMRKLAPGEPVVIQMERSVYEVEGVTVHATREGASTPAKPVTNVTADQINRDYLVSEFPMLLSGTPNLYSYADAGGGLGYSYVKIRGFDDKRISTYVNGIPLNDPEDQATYFVDLPDFAAEVTDIQIERGIGSSYYGDASFGGTINIVSAALDRARKISLSDGYGGFTSDGKVIGDMRKQAIEYSSGLVGGRWSFAGRYSRMFSDGYREGSWYDGWSYFLSLSRLDPNMVTTINTYGGPMRMHLAYYGVDRETLQQDRRSNPLLYSDETDNFNQPHWELHNTYHLTDNVILSNTLYYITGTGYYEQFKSAENDGVSYADYNLVDQGVSATGDLVRRQWVSKDQLGLNPRVDVKHESGEFYAGGAFYLFDSEHWGEVLWAEDVASSQMIPGHRYYEYFGKKFSASLYAGENHNLTERLSLSPSLQTKYIRQKFDQTNIGAFTGDNDYTLDWFFLSPRLSVGYKVNTNVSFSAMAAVSSRTPADYSIYDAGDPHAVPSLDIKPERVYDFEIGSAYRHSVASAGINLYWMEFRNEIVEGGGINDRGQPITSNAKRSVHAGIEMTAGAKPLYGLTVNGDFSVTYDRFKDYKLTKVLYDNDWNDVGSVTVDYSGNPVGGFPTYLGNLTADFQRGVFRLVGRSRIVGRQYVDNAGRKDYAIDPYAVFSLGGSATIANPAGLGRFVISAQVENLFDKKYETSAWSDTYYFRDAPSSIYAYYIPAAERLFFLQLKLEME